MSRPLLRVGDVVAPEWFDGRICRDDLGDVIESTHVRGRSSPRALVVRWRDAATPEACTVDEYTRRGRSRDGHPWRIVRVGEVSR